MYIGTMHIKVATAVPHAIDSFAINDMRHTATEMLAAATNAVCCVAAYSVAAMRTVYAVYDSIHQTATVAVLDQYSNSISMLTASIAVSMEMLY